MGRGGIVRKEAMYVYYPAVNPAYVMSKQGYDGGGELEVTVSP